MGIPDGGFAWTPQEREIDMHQDFSTERCSHLLRRIDSGSASGYKDFKENSCKLSMEPMKRMSELTYRILGSIDFEEVIYRRRRNFEYLHQALGPTNLLEIPDKRSFVCPMVYPYHIQDCELRGYLISNNIFVATYWPNVFNWCKPESIESIFAREILPLPIDQRYREEDMERIIDIIKK